MKRKELVYFSMFEISLLLLIVILPIIKGTFLFRSVYSIIFVLASIILFFKTAYELYEIDSTSIVSGLLFGKSVKLNKITEIATEQNSMVIYAESIGGKRRLKMSAALMENNTEKARALLRAIKERLEDTTDVSQDVSDFMEGKRESLIDRDYTRLGGSLSFILIAVLFFTALSLFRVIGKTITVAAGGVGALMLSELLALAAVIAVSAVFLYMFFTKKKIIIKYIKYYAVVYLLYIVFISVAALVSPYQSEVIPQAIDYIMSLTQISLNVFLVLLILDYFNTSHRVAKTFVN